MCKLEKQIFNAKYRFFNTWTLDRQVVARGQLRTKLNSELNQGRNYFIYHFQYLFFFITFAANKPNLL